MSDAAVKRKDFCVWWRVGLVGRKIDTVVKKRRNFVSGGLRVGRKIDTAQIPERPF